MANYALFVGIDWAAEEHQVALVDPEGNQLKQLKVKHDGEALERFVTELLTRVDGDVSRVVVGIEMTADAVVEVLLERGIAVYGLNPKQLDRFRDRHSLAGAKDDRRDAFVLADALRSDLRLFHRMELGDAKFISLRELSRARSEIVDQVQALNNRLWQQVHRYFPQMLELGSFHTDPWLLDLFELVPTPRLLKYLKRPKVEALLKKRRIRRFDADTVLTTLAKTALPVAPGVAEAASEHAKMVVAVLRAAIVQREHADRRIEEVLAELEPAPADDEVPPRTRDVDIVLSLPGVGTIVAATLLAEATSAILQRDYATLRTRSGVAPVTSQTGKQRPVASMRHACHSRLRNAVHIWSCVAIQHDERLRALYARLRGAGASHGRALRGVGDRSLAMLVSMLKSNTVYDPSRRASASRPAAPAAQA